MKNSKAQVIILDDEEHIIRLLQALIPWEALSLSFAGSARNGIEGKSLILEKKPDIVITDIKMPGADGLSLIADCYEYLPDTDFIIVSGFSQFDYAKKAIAYNVRNYLLKPISKTELIATLEKLTAKHRIRQWEMQAIQENSEQKLNSAFAQLLQGNTIGDKNVQTPPEFVCTEQETCRLCIIKLDSDSKSIAAELYHLLSEKIIDILKRHDISRAIYCAQDIICFLSLEPQNKINEFQEKLSLICFDLQKVSSLFPQLHFTLFCGSLMTDTFSAEYNKLVKILPLRRKQDASQLMMMQNFSSTQDICDENSTILDEWDKECEKMLDCLDPSYADSVVTALCTKTIAFSEIRTDALLSAAGRRFAVKAEERHPSCQQWFVHTFLPTFNTAPKMTELYERFSSEIEKLIAEIAAEKQQETIRPIRQADAYMQNHYMDYDISLEKVAEIVSLCPSYFSALYKKETGIGFLEALTTVRIKVAKRLLQETSSSIAVIASTIGYNDTKYFSRIFKKTTGITPNEFRQFYN